MTNEVDISTVLIDGEYATIMGVKYKRVEEPKPKMHLENSGEFDIVSYNDEIYYRLEYPTAVIWYKRKGNIAVNASGVKLVCVTDLETHRLLEDMWNNEVLPQKNTEPYCPDEPEYYDEVEWDEKDNPKPMDDVVNRLIKKYQAQKLWNMVRDELGYSIDLCDEIVDLVEKWLPEPQNASGSQNVDTELLVDGYNDCLNKLKEKLR